LADKVALVPRNVKTTEKIQLELLNGKDESVNSEDGLEFEDASSFKPSLKEILLQKRQF